MVPARMNSARWFALGLALFTVAYNLAEAGIAIWGAQSTGSNALLGFGLDSVVESLSGLVMVWRFSIYGVGEETPELERRASRLVAITFFVLGTYVILDSVRSLVLGESPEPGWVGLLLACASLVVMPVLFVLKFRLGKAIGSPSLVADSKETLACLMLSVALLVGVVATYFLKLGWIDAAVAIVIAILILREGYETWEESCADED